MDRFLAHFGNGRKTAFLLNHNRQAIAPILYFGGSTPLEPKLPVHSRFSICHVEAHSPVSLRIVFFRFQTNASRSQRQRKFHPMTDEFGLLPEVVLKGKIVDRESLKRYTPRIRPMQSVQRAVVLKGEFLSHKPRHSLSSLKGRVN